MGAWKAKQPRAKVPICWGCDQKLYAGGKTYVEYLDFLGNPHPFHKSCEELAIGMGMKPALPTWPDGGTK